MIGLDIGLYINEVREAVFTKWVWMVMTFYLSSSTRRILNTTIFGTIQNNFAAPKITSMHSKHHHLMRAVIILDHYILKLFFST